jgi:hypothetical protein
MQRAHEIDEALAGVLDKAEAGEVSDQGAASLTEADLTQVTEDGHYRIGDPQRPNIKFGDDFEYDSEEPTAGDHWNKATWLARLRAAQMLGHLPDGTAMYEHYWKNTGEPKEFYY